jgi:hypothetical protein
MRYFRHTAAIFLLAAILFAGGVDAEVWLAGDHHVHSRFSVAWNRKVDPPTPIFDRHGAYSIPENAQMAKHYGLDWLVTTDHGGRHHAKLNLELAYPDLLEARKAVPELVQFFGVELNSPGADHANIIVPHTPDEAQRIYELESHFDKVDADPSDSGFNTTERMIEALLRMREFAEMPVVLATHPSRLAVEGEKYGLTTPSALRRWNNAAPEIAVGMEGAPGRHANAINPDGSIEPSAARGNYKGQSTRGGYDRMTAELGGFWDSMLGEGRRWWVTANSDSHRNWTDGGMDFWPGEYAKTYVYADKSHSEILAAIRAGRIFVTTGDLVSELYVSATSTTGATAEIGNSLHLDSGDDVLVTIRAKDPANENSHGDLPAVDHIDLIVGDITGVLKNANQGTHPSTRVARRFSESDWTRQGEFLTMTYRLEDVDRSFYLRVRGTNTEQLEPDPDPPGEDPWTDLWFYSNPIFVEID